MGWNRHQEKIVASIGEKCAGYQWMLIKTTQRNLFYYRLIGIMAIPFTVISGTGYFTEEIITTKSMIFGIFGILSAILLSLEQFFNFKDNNQQLISLANKFQEIYNDATYILAINPEERQEASSFIPMLLQRYDLVCDTRPVISERIADLYKQYLRKHDIKVAIPDLIVNLSNITVSNNKQELDEITRAKSEENIIIPKDNRMEELKRKNQEYQLNRMKWLYNSSNHHT